MSNDESEVQYTQHAFLVAWGWFGEHIGLIRRLLAVSLHQKHYHHTPQGKVLEFLVAILAGLKHLLSIYTRKCSTHIHPHCASNLRQQCATFATGLNTKRVNC